MAERNFLTGPSRVTEKDLRTANVSVAQAPFGIQVAGVTMVREPITVDTSVAGATDMVLAVVGDPGANVDIKIQPRTVGNALLGSPVTITVTPSTAGTATITEVTGLTDEQLAYMTSAVVSVETDYANLSDSDNWSIYLLKKVTLG